MGHVVGLGYVRKANALPGTTLTLELEDRQTKAQVVGLPFVPSPEEEGQTVPVSFRSW